MVLPVLLDREVVLIRDEVLTHEGVIDGRDDPPTGPQRTSPARLSIAGRS